MSAPESDAVKASLFHTDPLIEYHMARVDRAAIREQLRKTPTERLEWLQNKVNEASRNSITREETPPCPGKKTTIDMGADPAWSAAAKAIPLLVPDPVIEAYVEDVDRGLIRQALRLSVSERFERFLQLTNQAYALRRACVRETRD